MRIAAIAGLWLVTLAFPLGSAQATLAPEVEAEFNKIVEFNYRGSAQPAPPPCSQVCQDLRAAETRPGGWSSPAAQELSREARNLRVATGLSKALRFTGTISLGPTAFELGYMIGSGANAKFFRIGMPATAPDMTAAPQRLSYYSSCSTSSPCAIGSPYHDQATITKPALVWQWDAAWNSPYGANWWTWRSNDFDCQHPPVPPDAPNVFTSATQSSTCSGSPDHVGSTVSAWWYQEDIQATSPVQDYAGQPYDYVDWWPPADPGLTTTATRTRAELESGRYPVLNQKLGYELRVPGTCDPVDPNVCVQPDSGEDNRKCDLSTAAAADPATDVSIDLFSPGQYTVVNGFDRRTSNGDLVSTALKIGWTKAPNWPGWGWWHIAARHGWTSDDVAATAAALLTVPVYDGGWKYRGAEYERNGAICQRVVLVGAEKVDPDEPSPKEIITSYGAYLRAAS